MLLNHIALVCEPKSNKKIGFRQLASVSAALQNQVSRDFGPMWGIQATVDPFESLDDVPLGYWPIIVADDIDTPGASGVHEEHMGQPYSLVQAGPLWSLTASHECLEMLVDPSGNRTVAGYAPDSAQIPSRVEFLVEVCDPCEDIHYAYSVNGIPVSDFYTPDYFDPCKSTGVRYDFTGHICKPRQVLPNGYLSWHDPVDNQWWQLRGFGPNPFQPVSLGNLVHKDRSMRSMIDAKTPTPLEEQALGFGEAGESALTSDGGGCLGCPPNQSFGDLLNTAIKTGKLLANGGGSSIDPSLQHDARSMRSDIDKVIGTKKSSPPRSNRGKGR
jgi:hypothetical protein